jgi:predicted PurR-regulated permease PerM
MPGAARLRTTVDTVAQRRAAVLAERQRRADDPWWASRQALPEEESPAAEATRAGEEPLAAEAPRAAEATDADPRPPEEPRFGVPGLPVSRAHPFYIGFMGAIGVLVAWFLLGLLGKLSSVLTLVVIALFLALALDPPVRALQRRGLRRGAAVAVVFAGVLALFTAFGLSVVPPLVSEATDLSSTLPTWVEQFQNSALVQRLDEQFGIINTITDQLQTRLSNGETVLQLFGGVLGAGQAVISGAFSTFTVLVLTLYFTASLNTLREAVYSLVPSTRRPRVRLLGDEIIRRIGGYTAGQVSVAAINGLFTYVGLLVLRLPFALVLAITVAILGLIPMVGATLGAVVITTVALFHSWQYAVIVIIYYLFYQQIENYLIAPRIMARAVKVPGFLAMIAALAGATLLGVLGALIAIPIAAGILLIVQEVVIPRQQRH